MQLIAEGTSRAIWIMSFEYDIPCPTSISLFYYVYSTYLNLFTVDIESLFLELYLTDICSFLSFSLPKLGTDRGEDDEEVHDESEEEMLRTQTVDDFLVLLEKPSLPQVLAQVLYCCC
jgi:hypothetical protein